jgi:hypothetical protein
VCYHGINLLEEQGRWNGCKDNQSTHQALFCPLKTQNRSILTHKTNTFTLWKRMEPMSCKWDCYNVTLYTDTSQRDKHNNHVSKHVATDPHGTLPTRDNDWQPATTTTCTDFCIRTEPTCAKCSHSFWSTSCLEWGQCATSSSQQFSQLLTEFNTFLGKWTVLSEYCWELVQSISDKLRQFFMVDFRF